MLKSAAPESEFVDFIEWAILREQIDSVSAVLAYISTKQLDYRARDIN